MIRHPKRKNAFYYSKRLFLFGIAVALLYHLPEFISSFSHIDTDKILQQSELKDKTMTPKIEVIETNGITAYLMEEHSNPIVSLSFAFKNSGSAYVPNHLQGITSMVMMMVMVSEGAGEFNRLQFNNTTSENGVKISFGFNKDDINGNLLFPSANRRMAVKLLGSLFAEPHITKDNLDLVKEHIITYILAQDEDPDDILSQKANEYIFGNHPYSRNQWGNIDTLKNITVDDMAAFWQKELSKDNLIIGISGDISKEEAVDLLNGVFGSLPQTTKPRELSKFEFTSNGEEHNINHQAPQAITNFFSQGTSRSSADFYPLYLANEIFGGSGLNSRLSKRIREKEGLTYGVYTYLDNNNAVDLIKGEFSATPQNFSKAKELLKEEWQKMAQNGVTEAELQEIKQSMINSFYLRFASVDNISAMLVAMQKYHLGIDFLDKRNDYIRAVTLQEVNAAAKKYFNTMPRFVNIGLNTTEE